MADGGPGLAYHLLPQEALDGMGIEAWAAWRTRYDADSQMEAQARALLDRAERALRNAGREVTIRTVWMLLADRAGDGPDMKAAAALAGMALGLRPTWA